MVKVTNATFCLGSFSVNMRTDASDKRYHQTLTLSASSNGGDFCASYALVIAKQSRKFAVRLYFVGGASL